MRYIGEREDFASVAPRRDVCNVYIKNAGGLWLSGVMVGLRALFDLVRNLGREGT